MSSSSESEKDSVRLSQESAAVLLKRATQLEAAGADRVSIAELREAARDAGIAPDAFEQALSEFHASSALAESKSTVAARSRRKWVAGLVLAAALLLLLVLSRMVVPLP